MSEPILQGTSTTSRRQMLNNIADLSAFVGTALIALNRLACGFEHPFIFTGIGLWALFFVLRLVQWKTNSHRRNLCLSVYLTLLVVLTLAYLIIMNDSPFRATQP